MDQKPFSLFKAFPEAFRHNATIIELNVLYKKFMRHLLFTLLALIFFTPREGKAVAPPAPVPGIASFTCKEVSTFTLIRDNQNILQYNQPVFELNGILNLLRFAINPGSGLSDEQYGIHKIAVIDPTFTTGEMIYLAGSHICQKFERLYIAKNLVRRFGTTDGQHEDFVNHLKRLNYLSCGENVSAGGRRRLSIDTIYPIIINFKQANGTGAKTYRMGCDASQPFFAP